MRIATCPVIWRHQIPDPQNEANGGYCPKLFQPEDRQNRRWNPLSAGEIPLAQPRVREQDAPAREAWVACLMLQKFLIFVGLTAVVACAGKPDAAAAGAAAGAVEDADTAAATEEIAQKPNVGTRQSST